jgi:transposase
MMSTTVKNPEITPIPVQLSETEFIEFIFPHLSMPKRGPKCKLGYHRLFNLILWVLYTGMQWKCLPIPKDATGKPAIHYTNVYRAFAKWADDGSLQQAFIASVGQLSDEKKLDVRVLHGDGTNTVAKKGEMASGILVTNIKRERRSSPSPTTMAMCCLPSPWLPSMRRI